MKPLSKPLVVILATLTLFFYLPQRSARAQEPVIFTDDLFIPSGITTDAAGNIYVASDMVTNARLTKFAPNGTVIWDQPYGGFLAIGAGHVLATDPRTGLIWNLWLSGEIYLVDPATGNQTFWFNVRALPLDKTQMQDIEIGPAGAFASQIISEQTLYGDLALHLREDGRLDAFLTANSTPSAVPYVMRIRFAADGSLESTTVLLLSIGGRTEFSDQAGGIAVNDNMVFTTIYRRPPLNVPVNQARSYQIPITISPDFPEDDSGFQIRFEGADLHTIGMATDPNGNFFMTTGTLGTTLCGFFGESALIILPANLLVESIALEPRSCQSIGFVSPNTRKIALSPAGDIAYVTEVPFPALSNRHVVWQFSFPGGVVFSQTGPSSQVLLPLIIK